MHLRRLIVLITNARNIIGRPRSCNRIALRHRAGFLRKGRSPCMIRKKTKITSLSCASPRVSGQSVQNAISLRCQNNRPRDPQKGQHDQTLLSHATYKRLIPLRALPANSQKLSRAPTQNRSTTPSKDIWWSQTGSNRRHPACKAGALPAELWPQQTCSLHRTSIARTPAIVRRPVGGPGDVIAAALAAS